MAEGCQKLLKVWSFLKTDDLLVLFLHVFPPAVKTSVAMKDTDTEAA